MLQQRYNDRLLQEAIHSVMQHNEPLYATPARPLQLMSLF